MAFTTNGNMHRHMRIHEKNFQSINGVALPNGSVGKPRRKKKLLLEKRDPASVQSLPLEKMADVHLALWIQNGHSSLSGGGRKRKLDVSEDDGVPKEQLKKVTQEMGAAPKRLVLTSRNPSNARKRPLIRTMKLLPLATTVSTNTVIVIIITVIKSLYITSCYGKILIFTYLYMLSIISKTCYYPAHPPPSLECYTTSMGLILWNSTNELPVPLTLF